MKKFSGLVVTGQEYIKKIEIFTDKLFQTKREISTAVGTEKEKTISAEIENDIDSVVKLQQQMTIILEKLKENLNEEKDWDNTTEKRIKENLYASIIKKYESACMKFQSIESEIKNMMQTRVIRDAEIILNRKIEGEERENILREPAIVKKYYEDKLTGTAHITLQNALADIEERHNDLLKLERVNNLVKIVH